MRLPETFNKPKIDTIYSEEEIKNNSPTTHPLIGINKRDIKPIITTSEIRLRFYDKLVKKKNSTEDVVAIGKMIQREFSDYTPRRYSSVNHSGNWKSSLLHNLLVGVSHIYNMRTEKEIIKSTDGVINKFSTETRILENKSNINLEKRYQTTLGTEVNRELKGWRELKTKSSNGNNEDIIIDKTSSNETSKSKRRRRSPVDNKDNFYSLTPESFDKKISFDAIQQKNYAEELGKIKKAINSYNELTERNSREGLNLLQEQANLLEQIKEKNTDSLIVCKNIESIMQIIKNEYYSHKVDIEKYIHAIWVAGAPDNNIIDYIRTFMTTYDGFNFNLWVDKKAFGAARFTSVLKQIAFDLSCKTIQKNVSGKDVEFIKKYNELRGRYQNDLSGQESYFHGLQEVYEEYQKVSSSLKGEFDSLFLENMIKIQDGFFNYCIMNGISDIDDESRVNYLKNVVKMSNDDLNSFKNTVDANNDKVNEIIKKLQKEFGEERISIKDVNSLESLNDASNRYNYQTEMLLRWNYPAASDLLRMYILKEHGGIYTDTDMIPAFSKKVVYQIMIDSGSNRFLEDLTLRRAISDGILKYVNKQNIDDVNYNGISESDSKIIKKILDSISKIPVSEIFRKIDTSIPRDTMPILRRYHLWPTGWNIRGLNGFMVSHKNSEAIDTVISGQNQAYRELQRIRENIQSRKYFQQTNELLSRPESDKVGGVLIKKYLSGSVFSDFRQDTIIPNALSTLVISGPDLIQKKMLQFFRKRGVLGKDFINGNKLGDQAYIGVYRITGTNKYDWLNPVSIGVNDVTPADASTWCIEKSRCVSDFLFKDVSNVKVEDIPELSLEKIDKNKFFSLWMPASREKLMNQMPDFPERYNALIENSAINFQELYAVDQMIHALMSSITDNIAKRSLFSLQIQISEYIKKMESPVGNRLNIYPNLYLSNVQETIQSINLFLKSNSDTRVDIFYSNKYEYNFLIRKLYSSAFLMKAYNEILKEMKESRTPENWEGRVMLQRHLELTIKDNFGLLSPSESNALLETSIFIHENQQINNKIKNIRNDEMYYNEVNKWSDISNNAQKNKLIKEIKQISGCADDDLFFNRLFDEVFAKYNDNIYQKVKKNY